MESQTKDMNTQTAILEVVEQGENAIAKYYADNNKDIVFCRDTFYSWNGNIWEEQSVIKIRNKVSTYMEDVINKEKKLCKNFKEQQIYDKCVKNVAKSHNMIGVVDKFQSLLNDDYFTAKLNILRDVINYKNGILNLRTGEFRTRVKEDYVSKHLNYDYKIETNIKVMEHVKSIIKLICNNDDELFDFLLRWLSYCITGETKSQKFVIMCGVGSNGKSTIMEIMQIVYHTYVEKIESKTFSENYQYANKNYHKLHGVRIAFVEEIEDTKLNIPAIKDLVNGTEMTYNIPFKTTTGTLSIHCKLIITCNKFPSFSVDGGMKRRGLICEFNNTFVDEQSDVNHKKRIYVKEDIKDLFSNDEYKNALTSILLEKTIEYYKTKKLTIPKIFEKYYHNVCDDNDRTKSFIDDYFIITNNNKDRISKNEFVSMFNQINKSKIEFKHLNNDLKRLNISYDRNKRINGCKGCLLGLKIRDEENNDSQDDPETDADEKPKKVIKQETNKETHQPEKFMHSLRNKDKPKPKPKDISSVKMFFAKTPQINKKEPESEPESESTEREIFGDFEDDANKCVFE